jgi:hypothetical protein
MAAISHGMNVEQVKQLGNTLKQKKQELDQIINTINTTLNNTAWEGPDAVAFKTQQWPDHRSQLNAIGQAIEGFGQSALNNASEQEAASGR